jgi:hypothetical protein
MALEPKPVVTPHEWNIMQDLGTNRKSPKVNDFIAEAFVSGKIPGMLSCILLEFKELCHPDMTKKIRARLQVWSTLCEQCHPRHAWVIKFFITHNKNTWTVTCPGTMLIADDRDLYTPWLELKCDQPQSPSHLLALTDGVITVMMKDGRPAMTHTQPRHQCHASSTEDRPRP